MRVEVKRIFINAKRFTRSFQAPSAVLLMIDRSALEENLIHAAIVKSAVPKLNEVGLESKYIIIAAVEKKGLAEQKEKRAPVEVIVHKNATHTWDEASLGTTTFRKTGFVGQAIVYRYNPAVTADSVKSAFDFLDRHVKGK